MCNKKEKFIKGTSIQYKTTRAFVEDIGETTRNIGSQVLTEMIVNLLGGRIDEIKDKEVGDGVYSLILNDVLKIRYKRLDEDEVLFLRAYQILC